MKLQGDTAQYLERIEVCLANLGTDHFVSSYLELVEDLKASQLVIMSNREDGPECLLCRNFNRMTTATRMTLLYRSKYYRKDPLFRRNLAQPKGKLEIIEFQSLLGFIKEEDSEAFMRVFKTANIADKTAILVSGTRHKLIVSLYFETLQDRTQHKALLSILGWLALLHYETREKETYPRVLEALSDREREVCKGILLGKKAEAIAAELTVATSTVITYRKRAYEKLGISSRASLFELCKGS